jgi:hypothetical protein
LGHVSEADGVNIGVDWRRRMMRAPNTSAPIEFLQSSTIETDRGQSIVELGGIFPRLPGFAFELAFRLGILRWRVDIGAQRIVGALALLSLSWMTHHQESKRRWEMRTFFGPWCCLSTFEMVPQESM